MTALGSEAGMCHQFLCAEPGYLEVPLDENNRFDPKGKIQKIDKFSIGSMAGVKMAMDVCRSNASWFQDFKMHDLVTFECVGIVKATQRDHSDMPEFIISVERQ